MKIHTLAHEKSPQLDLNAIHVIGATIGVLFGLSGINHGLFEFLQGNAPTGGLVIQAIGEAQRFWSLGTEEAFTIIHNFMISGLLAMTLGAVIIYWSLFRLQSRHGATGFLVLFILLFLVGGGIGQVAFFLPTWAFLTRMDKPLTWWKKILPPASWKALSNLWIFTLITSVLMVLVGIEIAIFGYFPGITNPNTLQNMAMSLVFGASLLNIFTFIAGIGHELKLKYLSA